MIVKFQAEELKKRLGQLGAVVSKKAAQPVYGFVRLVTSAADADGKRALFLVGLDIAASLTVRLVSAVADGDVDMLLPFSKLVEILSNINASEIVLTTKETKATISANKFRAVLESHPISDWPSIPERPDAATAVLALDTFKGLLDKVEFAVPASDGKHVVSVAKFFSVPDADGKPGAITAVATDGFRLAIASAPANFAPFDILLPKPALELVKRLDGGAQVTILEGDSGFRFETEVEILTVSRTNGTFPDYTRIFPTAFVSDVKTDTASLAAAVKRIKPLADDPEKPVIVFNAGSGVLNLSTPGKVVAAADDIFGDAANDEIDAEISAVFAKFGLNATMLQPFLDKVYGGKGGQVTIRLAEKVGAVVTFTLPDGSYQFLQASMVL